MVIREALANAFAHRDYATAGRVHVRVYPDRLEVVSPGGLHFGLTATDLYAPHGSHPWNPLVIGALYRRGIVDQLGFPDLTTRDLLARLREHGLVHPEGHGRGASWVVGPG